MSVTRELQEKVDSYFEAQGEVVQNSYDNVDNIKSIIETKVYLAKKLLDKGVELEESDCTYTYLSKENCEINIETSLKIQYKSFPLYFIDQNSFDLETFEDDIESDFITHLLLALNQLWDEIDNINQMWFFIPECTITEDKLKDFLQFVLLINGFTFHNPIETNENQFINDNVKNIFSCDTKNFSQYKESAYILSEYNYTHDILLKYLLLYHIVENFMYRRPIAEMATTGFTIREFKILYNNVKEGELQTLKNLLDKVKSFNILPGTSIEMYFQNNLTTFKGTLSAPQISTLSILLQKMGVQHINGISYKNASQLVYLFRNSIIHNKETEFHITHTTLNENQELVDFFIEFLLPSLENIVYFLIFQPGSLVDYPQNHILLYGGSYDSQRTIHEDLSSTERDRTTIFHRLKSKLSECRKLASTWR